MDSLTQMVLGAAVGEAAVGKKVGNRAMLWGAIAGTIPDLDVIIGNAFMGRLDALVFHRGFMHSILFALLFSFIIAYFVNEFYRKKWYLYKKFRIVSSVFGSLFITLIVGTVTYIMYKLLGQMALYICLTLALLILLFFNIRLWKKYGLPEEQMEIDVNYWSWYKLFFLSIVTHPILDCFTTFGTQLFSPFSDYRVAFNNVSVVDPLYTVPFAFCLFLAAFFSREKKERRWWNNTGIIVSSAYMCLTLWNKTEVNDVVKAAINSNQLVAERYMTSPTILNNILWNGVIETNSSFYIGQYSFFDSEKKNEFERDT